LNNKKNIKILFPIVVIIWGLVIYKIVDAFSVEELAMLKNTNATYIPPSIKQKQVFALLPIESDPFLGTFYNKSNATKNIPRKVSQKIKWPVIEYQGIISGKDKKSTVYIISISGQQHLLKKGDTLQGIKVIKGNQEIIHLKFKGQKREFPIM